MRAAAPDIVEADQGFDRVWPAVGASAVALMLSVGAVTIYPFGVFMAPLGRELGWRRGQMSGAVSIGQLALVLPTILWGILLDRFGPQRM